MAPVHRLVHRLDHRRAGRLSDYTAREEKERGRGRRTHVLVIDPMTTQQERREGGERDREKKYEATQNSQSIDNFPDS